MPNVEPTKAEFALHCRSIAKLRIQLFRQYSSTDYRIVENTERILPMSVWERIQPHDGKKTRHLSLGGLAYELQAVKSGQFVSLEIRHEQEDIFAIFASMGQQQSRYTRFAMTVKFSEIDLKMKGATDTLYNEQMPLPPMKPGRKVAGPHETME